ncbi:methyltransferase domain-containing protein [Sulfurimonas sp.]|jgi:malonyl-CoA O-methyltransferase|uniref:methyltransferase domain-containing protein n=1 Tax=Sulfurimonas sp. TaxID=2022749 RepID=UPI0025EA00E0|nr:methyltransferase domain-containing protein [Sulfurimonas sp.]MBT5934898.1 methyltransferase domain-containing protein [Sulfurimonas sp.]
MKISQEFSKHAFEYESYNDIQKRVADKLLSHVDSKPKHILDLGCGSGAICKSINWKYTHFIGVDFAPAMLELHPKSLTIESIYGDFNDTTLFEKLKTSKYDYIFSASALQWSMNLDESFKEIKALNAPISLAIFTSSTFKTLNKTASIESLLKSKEEIDELQKKYFDVNFEVMTYKLEFTSVREMFRYIKHSGVSGSRNLLSIKEMKQLMREYPINYLEFEVVFLYS